MAYAVTAWTRSVEDEHRMLSQALAILFAYPVLPRGELTGSLRNGSQRYPLNTRIAQERSDGGSNFWTAVGGQYKASLDYVVTLSCEPGTLVERGSEVRTQTLRTQIAGAEEATREQAHRFGGTVRDERGAPVAGAWVGLPESGRFAVTDARGSFIIEHVPLGAQKLVARGPDGSEQDGVGGRAGEPRRHRAGRGRDRRSAPREVLAPGRLRSSPGGRPGRPPASASGRSS